MMDIKSGIRKCILSLAFIAIVIGIFYLAQKDDQILWLTRKVVKDVAHYAPIAIIVAVFLTYFYNKYIADFLAQSRQIKRDEVAMRAMRAKQERLEEKVRKLTTELSAVRIKTEAEIESRPQDERELHQRLQHLNCLYGLSKIVNQGIPLDQIFQKTVRLIRKAYRYPNIMSVRIIFDGIRYETKHFKKSELSRYVQINANEKSMGMIER